MILETKLTLPQPKAGALLRTGLIDLIKNNLDKKLIMINAGAGYGKTTLVAQLVKEARLPAVFYDLDKDDGDLLTFYAYLTAGLEKLSPGLAARSGALIQQAGQLGGNQELLMGTLINELVEKRNEELYIILDDYQHLADDSPVHRALDYFIDHLPETVHVIVSSRSIVRFPNYSKWYAKQDAFELTKEQLAFTKDEARQLLTQSYPRSMDDDLKILLEHTEGWIAGIQLIVMRARASGKKSTIHDTLVNYLAAGAAAMDDSGLFEYFTSDILSCELDENKQFLVKTSVLHLLTPEACNWILRTNDSESLLKTLEKRNLFISRIGKEGYKYHRLFRDFLQKQIAGNGHDEKALHAKAAAYYDKKGMLEQAIGHYLDAGGYEKAARHILVIAREMGQSGRLDILDDWIGRLPESVLNKVPEILIQKGVLSDLRGCRDDALAAFARAEQAIKTRSAGRRWRKNDLVSLSGILLSRGHIYAQTGQQAKAISFLKRALKICPVSAPVENIEILNSLGLAYQKTGDFKEAKYFLKKAWQASKNMPEHETVVIIESNLAAVNISQGEIRLALELYKSMHVRNGNRYFWGSGMLWSNAANTALLLGDTEWARQCLEKGRAVCALYENDFESQAVLCYSSGLLHMQNAEWEQAAQCLEDACKKEEASGWKTGVIKYLVSLGALYRYAGNLGKSREYLEKARKCISPENIINNIRMLVEQSFLEIDCGHFDRAAAAISAALRQARKKRCRREEFMTCLAQASMCLGTGKKRQAARILAQAAAISKTKGYDGILIQELRHNRGLAGLALQMHLMDAGNIAKPEAIKLQVRMFGTFRMRLGNGAEAPFECHSRKKVSLLAYLLLNRNRVCNREELIEKIWPGLSLKQAASDLRAGISLLNKYLNEGLGKKHTGEAESNPMIVHQENGYRIAPALEFQIDVEEYQRHWHKAGELEKEGNREEAQKEYQGCVGLYANDFLYNLGERWCEEQREACGNIYISCLGRLASYKAANGEAETAAALFVKCIKRDPYSENVRMDYWKLLKLLGRKDDIRKDYHLLKKILYKDLKINPQPQTEECYNNLMHL